MVDDPAITEVRGGEVRCSGLPDAPHADVVVKVPTGVIVACPECGRRFRRATWWNVISGATWPDQMGR